MSEGLRRQLPAGQCKVPRHRKRHRHKPCRHAEVPSSVRSENSAEHLQYRRPRNRKLLRRLRPLRRRKSPGPPPWRNRRSNEEMPSSAAKANSVDNR
jgi:hypothetical protein